VGAKLSVCHLSEFTERSATYYFTGACEANYWFEFSAARRTTFAASEPGRKTHGCLGRLLHRTDTIIAAGSRFEGNNSILNGLWSATTKLIPVFARLRAEFDHQYLNK